MQKYTKQKTENLKKVREKKKKKDCASLRIKRQVFVFVRL